jgi:basic membrane lipoprotein Med (substrate-binding protein (PBP1-ABC) superfamily)/DNA-binding SARP family transcriptional activator
MAGRLEFKALGPIEVTRAGEPVDLGPYKQRSLLALLLARANQVVSTDRLIDALWGDEATDKEKTLWVYISRLRSVLEPDRTEWGASSVLLTKEPGYVLTVNPDSVDFLRFERALEEARGHVEAEPDRAVGLLDQALKLWRGDALADFVYEPFARNDIDRLTELRLEASELRFDAQLRLGHAGDLVTGLETFARENPYRERPVGQLMIALYRSGRPAEALRAYERHRRTVLEELGIDPSPELRRLEEQILLHDDRLILPGHETTRPLLVAGDQHNPYKGLHAFNESDETTFFGRENLVADLLRRIERGDRLIALVGPSGSGKSSVVRAGLIPRLRKATLPGSGEWFVAQMVPGAHPFTELEAALLRARLAGPERLSDQLGTDKIAILGAVLRVLPDDESHLLLVIDQFEELFALVEDAGERQRFLEGLLVALDDPHGRITVVLTLRADFYDQPLLHPGFGPRLADAVVNVLPLVSKELEEAASQPAAIARVRLEPALLARLIADVADQPGALPMFQYTLTELFERRAGDALLESAYDEMGGLRGAITNRAEDLYNGLLPDERTAARQLFLRLVTMSDEHTWSRRRVHASEIISMDADVVAIQTAIDTFGRHRLLLFDRDKVTGAPTVEVGHEALLTEWPRLEAWISRARHDLLLHASLVAAVDEWERADRDPGYLVTGARLAEYETGTASSAVELNARELEFLDAAVVAREEQARIDQERTRREASLAGRAKRRLWALVGVVAALVVVVTGLFIAAGDSKPEVFLIHEGDPDDVTAGLMVLGGEQAARTFDVEFQVITPPWTSIADVQSNLAEGGADLIIISSLLDAGHSADTAVAYPESKFAVIFEDFGTSTRPNHANFVFADGEAAYLAGVAAATESRTGVLGFVGAFRSAAGVVGSYVGSDIDARRAGFEAGARSVDPDAQILVRYLVETDLTEPGLLEQSFNRPDLGLKAARELFADGADIIFHAAGSSGLGIFQAARETTESTGKQVWGIGADSDQFFDLPAEDAQYVLMSTVRRLDTAVLAAVEGITNGQFQSGKRVLSLASGGVGYSTTGNKLAPATISAVEAVKNSIINRGIEVPAVLPSGSRDIPAAEGPADPRLDVSDNRYDLVAGGNLLTAVGPPQWRPTRHEENGVLTGFEVELLDEISDRLGLVVHHVDIPFEDMIPELAAGKYDLAIFQADITPERLEVVLFTSPHLLNGSALAVPRGSAIASIDDVSRVVVGEGGSHEQVMRRLFPEVELVIVRDPSSPPGLVERGEADALVRDLSNAWPFHFVNVQVLEELFSAFPVNPAHSELVADMNRVLGEMIADGTYGKLYDQWFTTPELRVDLNQ